MSNLGRLCDPGPIIEILLQTHARQPRINLVARLFFVVEIVSHYCHPSFFFQCSGEVVQDSRPPCDRIRQHRLLGDASSELSLLLDHEQFRDTE